MNWQDKAACRTADPEIFWSADTIDQADRYCADCPVFAVCKIENANERDGFWAGEWRDSEHPKQQLHRKADRRTDGRVAEVERMLAAGMGLHPIAASFGVSIAAISRSMFRAGRGDLAAPFSDLERLERVSTPLGAERAREAKRRYMSKPGQRELVNRRKREMYRQGKAA